MDKPKTIKLPKFKRRAPKLMDFARAHLNPPLPADIQKRKDREMLLIQEKRDKQFIIKKGIQAGRLAKKKIYRKWRRKMIKKLMRKHR